MVDYIRVLGDCFPDAEATVAAGLDPTVYSNLVWITTPIAQATLDASTCALTSSNLVHGGNMYNLDFGNVGTIKNKWLYYGNHGNTSDETPAIIPWESNLVGITFSNKNDDVDCDIEIYKCNSGMMSSSTLVYAWSLNNVRTAYKTDFDDNIVFMPGAKIGIYVRDQGNDGSDVTVSLFLQLQETVTTGDNFENYSGDLTF